MNTKVRRVTWVLALGCIFFAGCGDDESEAQRAENRCNDILDAYDKLWEGCGMTFVAEEFPCDLADSVDDGQVDACLAAISTKNCSSLGTVPNECALATPAD